MFALGFTCLRGFEGRVSSHGLIDHGSQKEVLIFLLTISGCESISSDLISVCGANATEISYPSKSELWPLRRMILCCYINAYVPHRRRTNGAVGKGVKDYCVLSLLRHRR